MPPAPFAHQHNNLAQALAGFCDGVFHFRGNLREYLPVDYPVSFHFPQLLCQHVLIYANGGQMTLLMNGLQYFEFEKVESSFSGEGSCTDALPNCVATGKPSLSLPCLGERGFGQVTDAELAIAMPANRLERTVRGLKALKETGLAYPIGHLEPGMDVTPLFEAWYPVQN